MPRSASRADSGLGWYTPRNTVPGRARKVRVNAVAPGLVIPTQDYSDRQMAALKDAMPLGLLPRPADVADAVAWLANAPAVTGQTLFVDGGAALKSFERDFLFLERDA